MKNNKIIVKRLGLMLAISSPSGAGKTSIARELVKTDQFINMSISVTTRAPRSSEKEGHDYYFVNDEKFNEYEKKGEFLEYAKVFNNRYGTLKKPVMNNIKNGVDTIFDIDWQGTQALREVSSHNIASIFILPPSTKDLEYRLRKRGQDSPEEVTRRMSEASAEITHWAEYDYVVINYNLEESINNVRSILNAERLKRERQVGLTDLVRKIIID